VFLLYFYLISNVVVMEEVRRSRAKAYMVR
jgi:hypothetical protein